ncbi:MAG: haloacid dehalogenase-like hydrolase [Candidatus Methylomirabilis sp.]|nr:haloacid dehalogenase-like hydrolase [Deltaproteobacteria bacterium]
MPAAIFNVDHTLLDAHMGRVFDAYALERGIPKAFGAAKLRAALAAAKALGARADRTLAALGVTAYRGVETNLLRREARACFAERLRPRVWAEAAEAIGKHKARGDEVVLASSSPEFVVTDLAVHLDADTVVALRHGMFGTQIIGYYDPLPYGEGKLKAVSDALGKLGMALGDATVYASGAEDLPLLEAAKERIAVNPSAELEGVAKAKGWSIQRWSTPQG